MAWLLQIMTAAVVVALNALQVCGDPVSVADALRRVARGEISGDLDALMEQLREDLQSGAARWADVQPILIDKSVMPQVRQALVQATLDLISAADSKAVLEDAADSPLAIELLGRILEKDRWWGFALNAPETTASFLKNMLGHPLEGGARARNVLEALPLEPRLKSQIIEEVIVSGRGVSLTLYPLLDEQSMERIYDVFVSMYKDRVGDISREELNRDDVNQAAIDRINRMGRIMSVLAHYGDERILPMLREMQQWPLYSRGPFANSLIVNMIMIQMQHPPARLLEMVRSDEALNEHWDMVIWALKRAEELNLPREDIRTTLFTFLNIMHTKAVAAQRDRVLNGRYRLLGQFTAKWAKDDGLISEKEHADLVKRGVVDKMPNVGRIEY